MSKHTSVQPTIAPDGRPAFRIECTCATHPEGMTAAIAIAPVDARTYPTRNIHGAVLGAHHPAIGPALAAKGVIWAA